MVNKKIKIIAEAGQGHEGSEKNVKNYINAASNIKVDYLKFHLIYADELAFKDYKFYDFFKKLELKKKTWIKLCQYAKKKKIKISFDVLGDYSLKVAEQCKVDLIKLHATDIYNYPLQIKINKSKIKNVILSTSGCYENEMIKAIKNMKKKNITCMLGYQNYPTKSKKLNLKKIDEIKKKLKIKVGYADHSCTGLNETIYNSSSAVSMGAEMIEKHLTFNNKIKIEDDESAISTNEFRELINVVNLCSDNIKKNDKFISSEDLKYRKKVSRSFYSSKKIMKNETLSFKNIYLKRGKNFNKIDIKDLLYKKAKKKILKDKLIKKEYLK